MRGGGRARHCATNTTRALSTELWRPPQARSVVLCSARPKEKDSGQGRTAASRFIASRLATATFSDCPPERKTTPATAGGTVRCSTRTVNRATSAGGAGAHDSPGVTCKRGARAQTRAGHREMAGVPLRRWRAMESFRINPSSRTPWSWQAFTTAAHTCGYRGGAVRSRDVQTVGDEGARAR